MKHLFFFPFPCLVFCVWALQSSKDSSRNCLGNKEPFLHRFCASPRCGNALKTKDNSKAEKRRCQKSGVRFKQTYKKTSKHVKRHKGATPAAWWFAGVTVIPLRHLAEDVIQIRGLGSIHSAISVSTPGAESADRFFFFDSKRRTSNLLQKMTWRHSFDINFCTGSNIIQNIYPCYSISGYYPAYNFDLKNRGGKLPNTLAIFVCTIFFSVESADTGATRLEWKSIPALATNVTITDPQHAITLTFFCCHGAKMIAR